MPSEQQLEYEITLARHDLEQNLQELQAVVRERLDVRKRAREAFERARAEVRAHVTPHVALGIGAAALLGGFWFGWRHE
jgi:ElaB/YqjD/DUF883 family membrane-anchored ribosome-binding protein